jgi:hypothetical protein
MVVWQVSQNRVHLDPSALAGRSDQRFEHGFKILNCGATAGFYQLTIRSGRAELGD